MIARVYFCVGTINYSSEYGAPNTFAFPSRIFGADEEVQAVREYERLAKHDYNIQEAFQYAYCIKMVGETRTIVKGEDWMLSWV